MTTKKLGLWSTLILIFALMLSACASPAAPAAVPSGQSTFSQPAVSIPTAQATGNPSVAIYWDEVSIKEWNRVYILIFNIFKQQQQLEGRSNEEVWQLYTTLNPAPFTLRELSAAEIQELAAAGGLVFAGQGATATFSSGGYTLTYETVAEAGALPGMETVLPLVFAPLIATGLLVGSVAAIHATTTVEYAERMAMLHPSPLPAGTRVFVVVSSAAQALAAAQATTISLTQAQLLEVAGITGVAAAQTLKNLRDSNYDWTVTVAYGSAIMNCPVGDPRLRIFDLFKPETPFHFFATFCPRNDAEMKTALEEISVQVALKRGFEKLLISIREIIALLP